MAAFQEENEYKFDLSPQFQEDAFLIFLKKLGDLSFKHLKIYQDIYYDTETQSLLRAGLGCRRRLVEGQERLEIKLQPKKTATDYFKRFEWKLYQGEIKKIFREKEIRNFLEMDLNFALDEKLFPLIEITNQRKVWILNFKNIQCEISWDNVSSNIIGENDNCYLFQEIEVELLQGKQFFELEELGQKIQSYPHLKLSKSNKLEKVLSHFHRDTRKTVKLNYSKDTASGNIAPVILQYYLDKVKQNQTGTELGLDPEFLHDMRVSVRKIRTAVPLFKGMIRKIEQDRLMLSFKWIADFLGSVRDCDVFLSNMRERNFALLERKEQSIVKNILKTVEKIREENRGKMLFLLSQKRYRNFMQWTESLFQKPFLNSRNPSSSLVPIEQLAKDSIISQMKSLLKKGLRLIQKFDAVEDLIIHKLRIKFKRLRYSIEYFTPVLGEKTTALLSILPMVQDVLGAFVDTFFSIEFLDDLMKKFPLNKENAQTVELLIQMKTDVLRSKGELRIKIRETLSALLNSDGLKASIQELSA